MPEHQTTLGRRLERDSDIEETVMPAPDVMEVNGTVVWRRADQLLRGSKEWRAEVLRLASECDRLGIPEVASALRLAEWKQT